MLDPKVANWVRTQEPMVQLLIMRLDAAFVTWRDTTVGPHPNEFSRALLDEAIRRFAHMHLKEASYGLEEAHA